MKTKRFAILITFAILLQGCVAYNRPSISLGQAADDAKPVKIIHHHGKTVKFARVEKVGSTYYGVPKNKRTPNRTAIDSLNIKSIHTVDRKTGSIQSTALFAAVIGLGFILYSRVDSIMDDFGETEK